MYTFYNLKYSIKFNVFKQEDNNDTLLFFFAQGHRRRDDGGEARFKVFPRKVNPGQNKLMLIIDAAPDLMQQMEVVFNYAQRRLVVEDVKVVKEDILQLEAPENLFTSTAMADVQLFINRESYGSARLKLESNFSMLEGAWTNQECRLFISVNHSKINN